MEGVGWLCSSYVQAGRGEKIQIHKYTDSLATRLVEPHVRKTALERQTRATLRLKINLLQYTFMSKDHHRGIYHRSILYNIIKKSSQPLPPG